MKNVVYVYRHRRLDTNEVFYIGIGVDSRATSKQGRSNFWKDTVNKYGYTIEILKENLTWEDAAELEIFLISLYGRRDLGLGTLVNLTDGGEGSLGRTISNDTRNKMSEAAKTKKVSNKTKKLWSVQRKGEGNPNFGKNKKK